MGLRAEIETENHQLISGQKDEKSSSSPFPEEYPQTIEKTDIVSEKSMDTSSIAPQSIHLSET